MEDIDYLLKYEYHKEILFSYDEVILRTIGASILLNSCDVLSESNAKVCKTVLFDNYSFLLKEVSRLDEEYEKHIADIVMDDTEKVPENRKKFIRETSEVNNKIEKFITVLMKMLDELSLKKMFVLDMITLKNLENLFNEIYEECENVLEYLEDIREDYI